MKNIFIFLSLLFLGQTQAQQKINQDNLQDVFSAYMDYFKEYEPLAPEPVRRAKFNKIVNKQNPNLSQADREKAFKIVDAYIRADKGLDMDYKISDQDKQLIKDLFADAEKQKEQGIQAMMGEVSRFQNMSYSEFKNFITQNGQLPLKEIEIKKAYNQMHKNDGKAISITAADEQKSKQLNQIEALDILREPGKHSFSEFKAAMKVLKPDISDEEIKEYWKKINKK